MDSPVIVDTASKFGRGIDLDREFPGFNFDDDGFGRRGDFRSHLDDLASRHPEFADHLLWDDIPFRGSLRNRRRGSGSGNNCQDEDAKSQASGSSAASGASAVSSHGEPEIRQDSQEARRKPIPKYGLRNTVDIGQHRMNMENPEKVNRNQRSMSAPPENRQPQQDPQQRFVSRVEITPQQQQQQQQQQQEQPQREKSPGPQAQPQPQQTPQQKAQQQGNVRHIPIFVEGRDEPVIPRNVDDVPFSGQSPPPPQFQPPPQYQQPPQYQSPPQYQTPPQFQPSPPTFQSPPTFHRPSHFNDRFGRQNWPSQFQEAFFDQPRWSREGPERPERPFKKDWTHGQQPHPQYQQEKHPQYQQEKQHPQYQQSQHPQYQQEKPQAQQSQQKPEPEMPKPKPTLPKDPLERVAIVQKEVDSLTEQVKNYKGTSRKDKEYIYLDEMLTRELIKLDDIETEGKENVRQARKNAIKSIQDSINLLEFMVPLPGQQPTQPQESENQSEEKSPETMDTEVPEEAHNDKPIPLPPGPCCSFPVEENSTTSMEQSQESGQVPSETKKSEAQVESTAEEVQKAEAELVTEKVEEAAKVEEIASQTMDGITEAKSPVTMEVQEAGKSECPDQVDGPKEGEVPKAAKSPKKIKKTKKQPVPVSEEAIPLPAPKSNQKGTK
ncbi:BAG domain-containing protein Samui-like isoform X2 [Belonocnema kinseyi]|uniref:BAG domain-containing protein Samui-like isoform X2 n=1 Tax=Belonocnema kinseyi TaxID=2817044 RepID=UPI00143DBC1A|nr:BAG domain-containing protein Samui-like isoform X2 [Belonocnema kinseyi]